MNYVLGLARFAFLGLLVFFLLYLTWLIKRNRE